MFIENTGALLGFERAKSRLFVALATESENTVLENINNRQQIKKQLTAIENIKEYYFAIRTFKENMFKTNFDFDIINENDNIFRIAEANAYEYDKVSSTILTSIQFANEVLFSGNYTNEFINELTKFNEYLEYHTEVAKPINELKENERLVVDSIKKFYYKTYQAEDLIKSSETLLGYVSEKTF